MTACNHLLFYPDILLQDRCQKKRCRVFSCVCFYSRREFSLSDSAIVRQKGECLDLQLYFYLEFVCHEDNREAFLLYFIQLRGTAVLAVDQDLV